MQVLGKSPARQIAKLADGNILLHRRHTQFVNGIWPGKLQQTLKHKSNKE